MLALRSVSVRQFSFLLSQVDNGVQIESTSLILRVMAYFARSTSVPFDIPKVEPSGSLNALDLTFVMHSAATTVSSMKSKHRIQCTKFCEPSHTVPRYASLNSFLTLDCKMGTWLVSSSLPLDGYRCLWQNHAESAVQLPFDLAFSHNPSQLWAKYVAFEDCMITFSLQVVPKIVITLVTLPETSKTQGFQYNVCNLSQWQVQSLALLHAFPSERFSDFRVAHTEPQGHWFLLKETFYLDICKTLQPTPWQNHASKYTHTTHNSNELYILLEFNMTVENNPSIFL